MSGCNQPTITDAAFENLIGIRTLNMSLCSQTTITDEGFANLAAGGGGGAGDHPGGLWRGADSGWQWQQRHCCCQ